jgi:hypothetical protein
MLSISKPEELSKLTLPFVEILFPHNHLDFLQGLQCAFLEVFGSILIFHLVNSSILCYHALLVVHFAEAGLYLSFETGKEVLILATEQVFFLMAVQDHAQLLVVPGPHGG